MASGTENEMNYFWKLITVGNGNKFLSGVGLQHMIILKSDFLSSGNKERSTFSLLGCNLLLYFVMLVFNSTVF